MITLHEPSAENWAGNGICVLLPTECEVEEEAGGMYELMLKHPISDDLRARAIQRGCLIKAPVPRMETPLIQISAQGHEGQAEHEIWRVKSSASVYSKPVTGFSAWSGTKEYSYNDKVSYKGKSYKWNGALLPQLTPAPPGGYWISTPAPSSVLVKLKADAELVYHGEVNGTWSRVTTASGTTGYMKTSGIEYLRTDPYVPAHPSRQSVVQPRQVREQLFRVYSVETDSAAQTVTARARHITYDLIGNLVKDYNAVEEAPQDVLDAVSLDFCNDNDFLFYTNLVGSISVECALKNGIEVLLDPDIGIVPKKDARIIRDNYDIFILANEETGRGVRIAYGKNLLSLKAPEDESDIVTRIIPLGKDKEGKPLRLPELYVDSQYIDDHPVIYAKPIDYDVQIKEATDDEEEVTEEDAFAMLREKAAEDFAKGCDLPDIDVDVDFIQLGDTEEYKAYKDLQQVFLYDTVTVDYAPMGMTFDMQVKGYVFDAVKNRYKKVKLGTKLAKKKSSVAAYQLKGGSIQGSKIAMGTIDSANLRNEAIRLIHLAATFWPDAPLLENAAVANAVPLDRFVAELALKASAESLQALESIEGSKARVALAQQSAQDAIAAALAHALDQVSAAKADLDAYKAEVKDYVDWASGQGLRFTYPDSPVTTELANDGMRIKYEGSTAAAFVLTGTHTPRLVVQDKASFGNPTDGYIQLIHTSRGLAVKASVTI